MSMGEYAGVDTVLTNDLMYAEVPNTLMQRYVGESTYMDDMYKLNS